MILKSVDRKSQETNIDSCNQYLNIKKKKTKTIGEGRLKDAY